MQPQEFAGKAITASFKRCVEVHGLAGGQSPCSTCLLIEVGDAFERAMGIQGIDELPVWLRVDEVKNCVAQYFGLPVGALRARGRSQRVVRPRQIAMYLSRKLTSESFPEIGVKFGRDHATVLVACQRVADMLHVDAQVRHDIAEIEKRLSRRGSQTNQIET